MKQYERILDLMKAKTKSIKKSTYQDIPRFAEVTNVYEGLAKKEYSKMLSKMLKGIPDELR